MEYTEVASCAQKIWHDKHILWRNKFIQPMSAAKLCTN